MKSKKIKALAKCVWVFCSYLFVPQWGKHQDATDATEFLKKVF